MAVLAPPIHIKGDTGPGACIRYIQDPEKIVADSQTANVMRYMQSHCIEEIASVGYNGCSGVCELAVEQFRLAEANYKASHPERKKQMTQISVLDYLESNHKGKLPKKMKPEAPEGKEFEMSLQTAMRIWRDETQSEERRTTAREVLSAHTLTITKTETNAEHLVISAHNKDNPSPAQLQAVADKFMEHPYLKDFPALSNIHWNTDEKHIHLLISNYASNGSRKLSLSGTKLRELRRYLDKICYEQGLSIIDTKEARLDPEHAKWIDAVKSEGKVKVWSEKETRTSKTKNWKADHDMKVAWKEANLDRNPQLNAAFREELKDFARNDLFFGDGKYLYLTPRPLSLKELEQYAAEARRRRQRENEEDERRRRRKEEEQWRYYYCVRIYVYDPYRHRYRQRSTLELLYMLARLVITNDSKFLDDNYPSRYTDMEAVINSPINWRIQNMLDAGNTARDLNCRTPDELERRVQEIGASLGEAKKAVNYDRRTIERGQTLMEAIQTWQDEEQPEDARKEAYHVMAAYKTTTDNAIADFVERYDRAQRRLPENEEHLQNLSKEYRNAKKAHETLLVMNEQCREVNTVAREAAKLKPELGALTRAAAQKAGKNRSGYGNEHTGWEGH